jgi:Nickel responsive protein SCO4226-like
MPRVIVERNFPEPLQKSDLEAVEERMKPCLDLYQVQWIRSYWSQDRKRMICEYEAPDAQAVREVQREAEAHYDTAWVADVLED